jgi:hypothetical protein
MTEEHKALDLDELFGQARAVMVKWQGKEYELIRLEALGPKAIMRFQSMQKKANELRSASMLKKQLTDEQSADIESLFDEMLTMLCQKFPVKTVPFAAKTKALEFYITETQGKKALDVALKKRTGATSSRK